MDDSLLLGSWLGDDLVEAPPLFQVGGNPAVPIAASGLDLVLEADAAQERGTGRGRLRFTLSQAGRPLLDLVPRPTRLVLNGQALPPERLRLVLPPDESTPLRMLDEPLAAGEDHELEIEYPLPEDTVRFTDGGVRLGLFMTDLDQRGYLERHAPANLEFDQVPMTLEVRISGSSRAHRLFTNGRATEDGAGAWRVELPDYFTCSSCYLHVTDRALPERVGSFTGMEREIPITAYGEREQDVERAVVDAAGFLGELEQTYGPYTHDALLIYCTGDIQGGMEYAGATMSDPGSLGHEITHSWFARGVMPANGNAGWIDEAIARWRDRGCPRASALPQRPPVNLAGFSPYRRHTPIESYAMGSLLLSELDRLFAPDGLRPILARLFQERQRRLITTPWFQSFLEQHTGASLGPVFNRYVYGQDEGGAPAHAAAVAPADLFRAAGVEPLPSPPPRAFTPGELRALL
ncbi:MAG: hypothetical protein ABUT39_14895 [Acidobacteriota bacterium]